MIKNIFYFKTLRQTQAGFTLIELLVVISIIGLLASVILVNMNSARSKARDAKRRADLKQIATALEFYYNKYGTYQTVGGGWRSVPSNPATACGCGWLGYKDAGSYPVAVTEVLKNEGFLGKDLIDDPKGPNPSYMIYLGGSASNPKFCLYATLENPVASETAAIDSSCASNVDTDYGKNFVLMN